MILLHPAGDADITFGSRFAGLGIQWRRHACLPLRRKQGHDHPRELDGGDPALRSFSQRPARLYAPLSPLSALPALVRQLRRRLATSHRRRHDWPTRRRGIDSGRYTKESSSIVVGTSLVYVGGSLGYCARRVAIRGRRGRRSPVAQPERLVDFSPPVKSKDEECPCLRLKHSPLTNISLPATRSRLLRVRGWWRSPLRLDRCHRSSHRATPT